MVATHGMCIKLNGDIPVHSERNNQFIGKQQSPVDLDLQGLTYQISEDLEKILFLSKNPTHCNTALLISLRSIKGILSELIDSKNSEVNLSHFDLTLRELEILLLMKKGLVFSEIASVLSISLNTISTHVKNIYRKMSVHSRSEAVYEATELGLI